jgi:hypothetical protein
MQVTETGFQKSTLTETLTEIQRSADLRNALLIIKIRAPCPAP